MMDKIEGVLEVGTNDRCEVVVNLDKDRTGHIVFSPAQAEHLAVVLQRKAQEADEALRKLLHATWVQGEPKVEHIVSYPAGDPQGLPNEPSYLVGISVPVTCKGFSFDPDAPPLESTRWTQAIRILVGLRSGMWSISKDGAVPVVHLKRS